MVAPRGACMVAPGGTFMVALGGCAWLLPGGVWLLGGACVVAPGGMHGCSQGGHAWDTTRYGHTINERAVRILLQYILVNLMFAFASAFEERVKFPSTSHKRRCYI